MRDKYSVVSSFTLVRMLATVLGLVTLLLLASAIVCSVNAECRNQIPTVNNLLNDTFTAPFIVTGIDLCLFVHFFVTMSIYYVSVERANFYGSISVFLAVCVYGTFVVVLFVLPFTGWHNDWGDVATLFAMSVWMFFSNLALKGARASRTWINALLWIVFSACSFIYIVVRAVPNLPLVNRDTGILVVQVVGGISLFCYICWCIVQSTRHVQVQISSRC